MITEKKIKIWVDKMMLLKEDEEENLGKYENIDMGSATKLIEYVE